MQSTIRARICLLTAVVLLGYGGVAKTLLPESELGRLNESKTVQYNLSKVDGLGCHSLNVNVAFPSSLHVEVASTGRDKALKAEKEWPKYGVRLLFSVTVSAFGESRLSELRETFAGMSKTDLAVGCDRANGGTFIDGGVVQKNGLIYIWMDSYSVGGGLRHVDRLITMPAYDGKLLSISYIVVTSTSESPKEDFDALKPLMERCLRPMVTSMTANRKTPNYEEDGKRACMRGRNLFVAIWQANTEREAQGLQSVWPRTVGSRNLSDDRDDIAGMTFRTSTDFFRVLFDMRTYGTAKWAPYVCGVDTGVLKLSNDKGFCDWIIAANLQETDDDVLPLLISANVDPSCLKTKFNGLDDTRIPFGSAVGRKSLPWCDAMVVVIRKGGATQIFKPSEFTYTNLYRHQPFSSPELRYLDVR